MEYEITNMERVYDGFFKIDKYTIYHETFAGGNSVEKSIEVFERGDSCAVLIYETDTENLLFTRQFRLPAAFKDEGWILEIVAGMVEENETPETTIKREIEEEIGYKIEYLEPIFKFYVSPGGTSERIFLYYAETLSTHKIHAGGGKQEENEDILLVRIPAAEIAKSLHAILDAKSIVAIQWFMLNKKIKQ